MEYDAEEIISVLQKKGSILLASPLNDQFLEWRLFKGPIDVLCAKTPQEVEGVFNSVERVLSQGLYVAGYVSYEAGCAFDNAITVYPDAKMPLVMMCVYAQEPEIIEIPYLNDTFLKAHFFSEINFYEYQKLFNEVKKNILQGNLYQVNLTYRCVSYEKVNLESLFLSLVARHPVPYAAYVNLAEHKILSISPELFLKCDGEYILSSPMKGTIKRHGLQSRDNEFKHWLALDPKNCAENLMITDMVRNDLGRISQPGSVCVDALFHIETYDTVHQMVSKIRGKLDTKYSLFDIFKATFPPASITGAPKVSATHLIAQIEKSPRGIYTGVIGYFAPGKQFQFNVAIRTLVASDDRIQTGVGGGVVYDSTAEDEWQESIIKTDYLTHNAPSFEVFETLSWRKAHGYSMLEEHVTRAYESQLYFNRKFDRQKVITALNVLLPDLENGTQYANGACVKFVLDKMGDVCVQCQPLHASWEGKSLKLLVSPDRMYSSNRFLYHKTTHRACYHDALCNAQKNGFDEVIFLNEKGFLTEGSISNLFIRRGDHWFTPALTCGLLPGIWRAQQIKKLRAIESNLTLDNLCLADQIIIGNSVRGGGNIFFLETPFFRNFFKNDLNG